jgi:hypothetical protein
MRKWQQWAKWGLFGVALLSPAAARAVDPAVKCESDKLKAVGKYAYCRLLEQSKAARSFGVPDFSKCDAAFAAKWSEMEQKAASQATSCWTTNDGAHISGMTGGFTDSIEDALGVPAY